MTIGRRSCFLITLISISTVLSITAASRSYAEDLDTLLWGGPEQKPNCEDERAKGKEIYKKCMAYLSMAGTTKQRQSASEQAAKDREKEKCHWEGKPSHRFWACGNPYGSPTEYMYKQQKEKEQASGDKPLVAEPSSSSWNAPSPSASPKPVASSACPRGQVLARNGQCVGLVGVARPCPPGLVLARNGQCVGNVGVTPPCPRGQVLARNGQCVGLVGVARPCPPGLVLARNGQCVGDFARLRR
jgi:hypothetical protein